MATSDYFHLDAEVGSDDDESFDEDGEVQRQTKGTNGHFEDSSDEEEDDDDEEAAAAVREGFIVDGPEDEDEEEEERRRRRREKKKRRREERDQEDLDEDDLALIEELKPAAPSESKFKRLKRGHREDRTVGEPRGVDEIFADDDDVGDDLDIRRPGREDVGEFDDFIEEDEFPDEERDQRLDDEEVSRRPKRGLAAIANYQQSGLDEGAMEDMRGVLGDGTEYDWALDLQEDMVDEPDAADKQLELKDVFEPSQLAEKMLTDEDNIIRETDIPERFQLLRRPFTQTKLGEDKIKTQLTEEAAWISSQLLNNKPFASDGSMAAPFVESVRKVLEFYNMENFEPPFVYQHRRDYLIYAARTPTQPDPSNPSQPQYEVTAQILLEQDDLWEILNLDIKYRALTERREAAKEAHDNIQRLNSAPDTVVDDMLSAAIDMEDVQDVQDYLHFQYSAELKDVNVRNSESNGVQKRARPGTSAFERLRASPAYVVVRSFGITADSFAQSLLEPTRRAYTDDPPDQPDDLADKHVDGQEFPTGSQVLRAGKAMFAEEITMSPRMKKFMRQKYFKDGRFDCIRTEKGLRKIDEEHPYYEFKYLRNQKIQDMAIRPEMYLRMLKAEEEGLVEVKVRLKDESRFRNTLYKTLESDNFSEIADAWNKIRREVLDVALGKLEKIVVKIVKENLKSRCEDEIAKRCRKSYYTRLDQAPYKPKGMVKGTVPRVLALSNGSGISNRDAINWAFVDEQGRLLEYGKFTDLRPANPEKSIPESPEVTQLLQVIERRNLDVIAVSGFSVETRSLYKGLQSIVEGHKVCAPEYDDDRGSDNRDLLDVVQVNDEVARLYHTSDRSNTDYPGLSPMTKYCVALAKYLQSPMKEYAALGRDIISISFNPNQNLIPTDKLTKYLETAMVDMVNLVGVEINDAIGETYVANLLPYICGLGPRKVGALVHAINRNGGVVGTREELVGDPESGKIQAVGANVWTNCASFLYIDYDISEPQSDYLDNTRIHPEDYDLARKIAADALDFDEEDIKAEVDEGGAGAVVRKLVRDEAQEAVNDLVLKEYAEQLERNFSQRKRATLETIRAELQGPYEELRHEFTRMSTDAVFTMLTGETNESLVPGMVVPVVIKRVFSEQIECRLDCGIEGKIYATDYPANVGPKGVEPRQAFQPHQTVQAVILSIERKTLSAILSLRIESQRKPQRRGAEERMQDEWDEEQETKDKRDAARRTEDVTGRAQRVIKHPLFKAFNATQAEEYLGPMNRGDVVIRPSSKGLDHLAVTWKVSDNVFQHIDVLELDKENEFSVGRTLKIGGRYSYSDLDELIVNHVKAMAKKVDEIMMDDRFQSGSKAATEQWLTAYMEANPTRSMYTFCINREFPGYFTLCFKAGPRARHSSWPIKIIPNAFELQKNPYPDMRALKNGFKTLFVHQQNQQNQQNGRGRF